MLFNALSSLPSSDLADCSRVNAEALSDGLVGISARSDSSNVVVVELGLRDATPVCRASMPFSVRNVLSRCSDYQMRWIDASGVVARMTRVVAAWRKVSSGQYEYSNGGQRHLAPINFDRAVSNCRLEGMRDAGIGGVFSQLLKHFLEPLQSIPFHDGASAKRVAVSAFPLVVRATKAKGVMRPFTFDDVAESVRHRGTISTINSCCLSAVVS